MFKVKHRQTPLKSKIITEGDVCMVDVSIKHKTSTGGVLSSIRRPFRRENLWTDIGQINFSSLLLLLLSHFSRVRLCVTPETAAHQTPPSLGLSRQEHWSGLPFLSPMHESEKWKWSRSVVFNSSRSHGLQPTRLLHPWDFSGKNTGVGCHSLCMIKWDTVHYTDNCLKDGYD